jgi:ribulose-phosphate 3-epimerase
MLDLHMMVARPGDWVTPCAEAGGDMFTFHIEAASDPGPLCRRIKEAGMKVGIGLKPGTGVEAVVQWVDEGLVDMVLVMTVEPGFGGQSFMPGMMPKVEQLRAAYPTLDIEVDGGVGPGTVDVCAAAGANMIVSGTAVVRAERPAEVIRGLRQAVQARL